MKIFVLYMRNTIFIFIIIIIIIIIIIKVYRETQIKGERKLRGLAEYILVSGGGGEG